MPETRASVIRCATIEPFGIGRSARWLACLAVASICTYASNTTAQDGPGGGLQQCDLLMTPDARLVREVWATSGNCESPVRVRITDRRLGFTCVKAVGEATARCRAFVPPPMAQELDRSRFVHCVGVELTTSPGAVSLSRVDEWIGSSLPCALYPPEETTTAQIDLDLGRACITPSEQCIAIAHLSALGRRRVQGIVQEAVKAFLSTDPKTYLEEGT